MAIKGYTAGAGNTGFRDNSYSPAEGLSLWETCPTLAFLCDPSVGHIKDEPFDNYTSGDWTVSQVAGSGTVALQDAQGGVIKITNGSSDNDETQIQKKGEAYKLATGKPLWFETEIKVNTASQADIYVGLGITNASSISGASDGVTFRMADDSSAAVKFYTEKNSTETESSTLHTMGDDTYVRLGFYFDGAGSVTPYVNGSAFTAHTTNVPDDEELSIIYAIRNGSSQANTMSIQHYRVAHVY